MEIGVIIGRFQLVTPHSGHRALHRMVEQRSDKVIILVGESRAKFTNRNPLPYENRAATLRLTFRNAFVAKIEDQEDDEVWSENVDSFIKSLINPEDHVTLYGSRDSFVTSYTGKFKTVELVTDISTVSSTQIREAIGRRSFNSPAFSTGIIYAIENRFPAVYSTVDIAVLHLDNTLEGAKTSVLLAKKKGRKKWCFPGGFVDKTDKNLIDAAYRELHEEILGIEHHELTYVGSSRVDDWRYKGTKDGIMTNLFVTYLIGGNLRPGDDLADGEISFFDIETLDSSIVVDAHIPLIELLKNHKKYKCVETS